MEQNTNEPKQTNANELNENTKKVEQVVESNIEKPKFEIDVPYNNEIMVQDRKKRKIGIGSLFLGAAAFFIILTIFASTSNNSSLTTTLIFVVFDLLCVGASLPYFCTIKPNKKDDNKIIKYLFYQDYLQVHQDNMENEKKNKTLEFCLYRKMSGKQFVAKGIEYTNKIEIRIFTGTYNGVPQYASHIIPLSMFKNDEELTNFKNFLKQKLESDYIVKLK